MNDFPSHIIYHIDVNSAFLSWTAVKRLRDNPEALDIRTIPAVIGDAEMKRNGMALFLQSLFPLKPMASRPESLLYRPGKNVLIY